MNILHLHPGPDTGGKSMAAKAALEQMGDECRVFARSPHRFGYPEPEPWDDAAVEEAHGWADVVVYHNEPALLHARVGGYGDKPLIVHHHGNILRKGGPKKWAEGQELGAVQVVSTLDLLTYPDGGWLPQIVDLSFMAAIRAEHYQPGRVRVVQAPTGHTKGHPLVKKSYRREHGLYELVEIRHAPWLECLARKATGDVLVDQVGRLALGYGANAVEAWGMGMPVISSGPPDVLARMRDEWVGLPFYAIGTHKDDVGSAIREFVLDAELRAEWAARGLAHARRFHDVEPFVAAFRGYAEQALGMEAAA